MSAMLAIAIKDLRTFTRQRASLFFTFIWPLCVAVLFGVLFGGSDRPTPRLPIVVVDEDKTEGSRAFADRLVDARHLRRHRRGQPCRGARGGAQGRADRGGHAAAWLRRGVLADVLRHAARGAALHGPEPAGRARHARGPADAAGRRADAGDVLQSGRRAPERAGGVAGPSQGAHPARIPGLEKFLGQLDTFLGTPDARGSGSPTGAAPPPAALAGSRCGSRRRTCSGSARARAMATT